MVRAYAVSFCKDLVVSIFWVYWAASFLRDGRTLHEAAVGIGSFFLFCALCELPSGLMADTFGRKINVYVGSLLLSVAFLLQILHLPQTLALAAFPLSAIGITLLSVSSVVWLSSYAKNVWGISSDKFVFNCQILGRFAMISIGLIGDFIFQLGSSWLWGSAIGILLALAAFGIPITETREKKIESVLLSDILVTLKSSIQSPTIFWILVGTVFFGIESGIRNLISTPYILSLQNNNYSWIGYFSASLGLIRLIGLLTYRFWLRNRFAEVRNAYYFLLFGLSAFSLAELNASYSASYLQFYVPYASAILVFGWYFAFRDIIVLELSHTNARASIMSAASLVENCSAAVSCFLLSNVLLSGAKVERYWAWGAYSLIFSVISYYLSLRALERKSVAASCANTNT
jgi:MFS family permease